MTAYNIPAGEYTPAQVRAAAWNIYAAQVRAHFSRGKQAPSLDRRYNFNREVVAEFNRITKAHDIEADHARHIARRRLAMTTSDNIKAAPLVRDYYANRHQLRRVCAERLEFYGRNHWAKNDRDRRILAILAKNFARWKEERK